MEASRLASSCCGPGSAARTSVAGAATSNGPRVSVDGTSEQWRLQRLSVSRAETSVRLRLFENASRTRKCSSFCRCHGHTATLDH